MSFKQDKRLKGIFLRNFFLSFLGVFFFICILMIPLSWYMLDMYQERISNINENSCERSKDVCETIMKEVEMYVVGMAIDTDVQAYISSDGYNEDMVQNIQQNLRFYKSINDYIDYLGIYSEQTGYLLSESSVTNVLTDEFIETTQNEHGKISVRVIAKNGKYPLIIRFSKGIDVAGNKGISFADINIDKLNTLFNSTPDKESERLFIVDDNDRIIYSNNLTEEFGKDFSEVVREDKDDTVWLGENKYIKSQVMSDEYNFKFITMMPATSYSALLTPMWKMIGVVAVISIILGLLLAFFLSRVSVNPVGMILKSIEQPKDTKKLPTEIQSIVEEIIGSVKKLNDSEHSMRMLLLKFAHIQIMESQMNPHFLYNSLDSINWMAFSELGKDNLISASIEDLSEVFRLGLRNEGYLIVFEDELNHAMAFARLLKIRYKEMVDIDFFVGEETKKLCSIQFVLQPIIENAMYHGIKPANRRGRIKISARTDGELFIIEVDDDGVGITEERLNEVNDALSYGLGEMEEELKKVIISWQNSPAERNMDKQHSWWLERKRDDVGIGIKNVNNRIKLIFGSDYGVEIKKNDGNGVTVKITMPAVGWNEEIN